MTRKVTFASVLAITALAVVPSCSTPAVTVTVRVPEALLADTQWIELGAFPERCLTSAQLAGGLPESGAVVQVGYDKSTAAPSLGLLASGAYGFAAVARAADCSVLAAGCTVVDVTRGREVVVDLDATKTPDAAKCAFGTVCSNGHCVPPTSGADPAVGEGCSMQLMGAGPLANALSTQPFVGAPAIAATATGFVVAYSEYPAVDGSAACGTSTPCVRVTLLPLDEGGGALPPKQATLDGYCPDATFVDPVGLTMDATGGVLVLGRPPCNGKSGLELLPLDATGVIKGRNQYFSGSAPTIGLSLHATALASTKGRSLLALRSNGNSGMLSTDSTNVTPQVTTPFGTASDEAVRLARGATVLGVEVEGPGTASGDAAPPPGNVARIYVVGTNADPDKLGVAVDQVPAVQTAFAASGARVFLVYDTTGKGQELGFRAYELGKPPPVAEGTFSPPADGALAAMDAAATKDRLFVATLQSGAISVSVIEGASSAAPSFARRVDFAKDGRIPGTANDGPVSVFATDTRVVVVWAARKGPLTQNDATGGYAIFACR
ncbi:MAG TPA: hypothetical protein VF316_17985 [Polyangiaceae bacterium]